MNALRLATMALCGLFLAGCTEATTPVPETETPYVETDVCETAYYSLVMGGSLSVGTVRSVDNTWLETSQDDNPSTVEHGVVDFAVEKTLRGENLKELTFPYACYRDDLDAAGPQPTDWGGMSPWDGKHPMKGQRLMLLCHADDDGKPISDFTIGTVRDIWRLRANDPLVPAFEEAMAFLSEKDPERRRDLFRNLCRSPLKNIRAFASYASFGAMDPRPHDRYRMADPVARSELVLDFLRYADPTLIDSAERRTMTGCFADGIGDGSQAAQLPRAFREAFEDWYLTELASTSDPENRDAAVSELCGIIFHQRLDGLHDFPDVIKVLFPKGGLGPLRERLEACSHSGDAKVKEKCEEVLQALREP